MQTTEIPTTSSSSSSSTPQDSTPQYTPTWSKINSKDSYHRYGHTSVIINDFIVTIGGCSASGFYTNDIIAFDLKKSLWLSLRPSGSQMPHCYGHSAVKYKENQIIVFGGYNGEQVSNKVSVLTLDPGNSFNKTKCVDLSTKGGCPSRYFHSAHIYNDSMYVFGGRNGLNSNTNEVWCLDHSNFTWTLCQTRGEIPEARGGHSSVIYGNQMYVFGGYSDKHKTPLGDMHALDLDTLTWRKMGIGGLMPTPRHGANLVVLDQSIYLFGGSTKEEQYNNDNYVYKPKKNEWKKLETEGNLYSVRKYGSAVAWKNNVVIWGGRTPEEGLSEIFLLDLDFNKRLLFQKANSDVAFQIGDIEIPAHKEVLYEKCNFFKNMFDSGMVESQGGKIQVFETNIEAFRAMLSFIYLNDDDFKLKEELVEDLLELADKYLLVNLREKCVKHLLENLEMNKVTAYLEITERLGLNEMEDSLLDFTLKNLEKIEGSWEEYKFPESFLWRIIFKLRKATGVNVGNNRQNLGGPV